MQDREKMSPDEIRRIRDAASFVARMHNGEYEIWHRKGMSLLKEVGWESKKEGDPSLIYVIGAGGSEKYVFVSDMRGKASTYIVASRHDGISTGIATWHEVLAKIGIR